MNQPSAQNEEPQLVVWDYENRLQKVDGLRIRLSKGFLKCKPDRWFPSFSSEWMPLLHSLGLEAKIASVTTTLELSTGLDVGYGGTVEGEGFGIFFDRDAVRGIIDSIVPGSFPEVRDLVLEYMARRVVATLASTWSGGSAWEIYFDNRVDPFSLKFLGAIKIELTLNTVPMVVWIGLGERAIDKLDGLWRRQVHSSTKNEPHMDLHVEVSQLAVPPTDLVAYTRSGTVIDLEVPITDTVTIRSQGRSLFVARIVNLDGRLGLETLPLPPTNQILPEGMTRVAVEFGKIVLDPQIVGEYSQPGTVWDTGLGLSENVLMVISGETMARAVLCEYQDRFALSVS